MCALGLAQGPAGVLGTRADPPELSLGLPLRLLGVCQGLAEADLHLASVFDGPSGLGRELLTPSLLGRVALGLARRDRCPRTAVAGLRRARQPNSRGRSDYSRKDTKSSRLGDRDEASSVARMLRRE